MIYIFKNISNNNKNSNNDNKKEKYEIWERKMQKTWKDERREKTQIFYDTEAWDDHWKFNVRNYKRGENTEKKKTLARYHVKLLERSQKLRLSFSLFDFYSICYTCSHSASHTNRKNSTSIHYTDKFKHFMRNVLIAHSENPHNCTNGISHSEWWETFFLISKAHKRFQ